MREIPPSDVLAEERSAAARVDGALAHDAGVFCAVARDERLATVAVLGDDAASAGREIVDARIARGDERGVFADDESDAGTKSERAGEEDVHLAVGAKDDGLRRRRTSAGRAVLPPQRRRPVVGGPGLAGCAVVERILDAGGGELLLIGEGDDAVIGGDVGLEGDAGGRDLGSVTVRVSWADRAKAATKRRGKQAEDASRQNAFGFLR